MNIRKKVISQLLQDTPAGLLGRRLMGYRQPEKLENRCLIIACFPKSGSTYLARALRAVTGHPTMPAYYHTGHNEQDLYEKRLTRCHRHGAIVQQHLKAGNLTVELLQKYNLHPVIQVRNIFDVVISNLDHMEKESAVMPTGYAPSYYNQWSREECLDWIIDICIPWYFNFSASWVENCEKVGGIWVTYEELFEDVGATVQRVLDHWGVAVPPEDREARLADLSSGSTRLNVGKKGRGASLSDRQKERIIEMASRYRFDSEALNRVGLPTS